MGIGQNVGSYMHGLFIWETPCSRDELQKQVSDFDGLNVLPTKYNELQGEPVTCFTKKVMVFIFVYQLDNAVKIFYRIYVDTSFTKSNPELTKQGWKLRHRCFWTVEMARGNLTGRVYEFRKFLKSSVLVQSRCSDQYVEHLLQIPC